MKVGDYTISLGRTINTGDYNSVRVEVSETFNERTGFERGLNIVWSKLRIAEGRVSQ
jgi:hypothetical protein